MRNILTSRGLILQALLAGLLAGFSGGAYAQQHVAPIVRRPPPMHPGNGAGGMRGSRPNAARGRGVLGEHLPEWMSQHSGLTLQQQEQALDREPGFRELPAPTQQQMRQRLAQLNAMPLPQRQRILEHNEAMERLSLVQRSQVRGAMQQLGSLPPDQRREVARSFRELRLLPQNQRMGTMLYSGRYRWLNEAQRTTLTNLLQVAPMLPPE